MSKRAHTQDIDDERSAHRLDPLVMLALILCFGWLNQFSARCACLAQEQPRLIGNSSCATATCHGGVADIGPAWHSSANVWESGDPHVQAGEVLFNDVSKRIVSALAPRAVTDEERQQVLVTRCAGCHAPAALVNEVTAVVSDADAPSRSDGLLQRIHQGVSCESCHGAASNWLVPHTRVDWPSLPAAQRYSTSSGMMNTEDLASRVDNCARCHMGSRTADGVVRDMNHDMIAAGHPRLENSMFVLLSRLPSHWQRSSDALGKLLDAKGRPQTESAVDERMLLAAVRLSLDRTSESRAADADLNRNRQNKVYIPQPELSEYDCVACHRSYIANPQRPSRGLPRWQSELTNSISGINLEFSKSGWRDELILGRAALDRFLSVAPTVLDERSLQQLRLSPPANSVRGAQ